MKHSKEIKNIVNGYVNTNVVVDITTVAANSDNKAYLIDKRLLDFLLERVTNGSLDDIKDGIKGIIDVSDTKEELFAELDNYIYLDKIVQLVNPIVEGPTMGEAIDMVANGKTVEDWAEHPKHKQY